jgi:tetratricopeptide (TPR) repeat protein
MAYADGDFNRALVHYEQALGAAREKAGIRLARGRIFGMRGEVDSARRELTLALDELRKQDEKELVLVYNSKAMAEFSIAVLREGAGDADGARESYAQALQEDLAYYPAHLRMGLLALGRKDTTTAVSELALAAEIAAEEPHVRYVNGYVLAVAGKLPEAAAELEKTVGLEPFYALPWLRLGQVYELMGKGPEALRSYTTFLERASQKDGQREHAAARIAEIKDILGSMPASAPAPATKP